VNYAAIVMHRFPQTPEEICKAIMELDYKFITIKTMNELRNLFPPKTYEEEVCILAAEFPNPHPAKRELTTSVNRRKRS